MPLIFRNLRFHLSGRSRLLSFCTADHAIDLQTVAFPSSWALEAIVFLPSRTCHWSSESGVSIFLGARSSCRSAQQTMPLIFRKVSFPSFWALHADVLSFCTVEHATGLQKVVFRPSGRSRLLSFCTVEHAVYLQKVLFPSFLETEVVLGELARASFM